MPDNVVGFNRRNFVFLVIGNLLAWWLAAAIGNTNLDGYNDMLETYVWGQNWVWSGFKHPPLAGWLAHLWFDLFPRADAWYYLLSCVNVAGAITAVGLIAREWLSVERTWLAMMALLMALPYSTLAYKFNANSILLLTWPWTSYFFLRSLRRQEWWATVGLGVMGALAMLGKYYSGLLLVSFLVASLLTAEGRAWMKTWHPYTAALVFLAAMTPHVMWVVNHDFVTLRYVEEQGDGRIDFFQLSRFAEAPLLYWGVPWLLILWRCYEGPWLQRMRQSLAYRGPNDLIFWLCLCPWAISLVFGLSSFVDLSLPWAIPIGFAYSLLWLRNAPNEERIHQATGEFRRALPYYFLAVITVAGAGYGYQQAVAGVRTHYLPYRELTQEILSTWQHQHPGTTLGWTGGEWELNGMIPFYGNPEIIALPGVPTRYPATEAPLANWEKMGGVMICNDGEASHPTPDTACHENIESWLKSLGQSAQGQTMVLSRTGWRFPKATPFQYTVYWYDPAQQKK